MILEIASGKGGTGKTTISVNLARAIGSRVTLMDCDVEEPNCHLFLSGKLQYSKVVGIPVPQVSPPNLEEDLKLDPITTEDQIQKLAEPYITAGMTPDRAKFAAALELQRPKEDAYQMFQGQNARPSGPHSAWGHTQTGVTGAGLALAPFTGGVSMPVAGGVNMAVEGLKKLFG